MIFYTLRGPKYHLEIHEDKIQLIKKPWLKWFFKKKTIHTWEIHELSLFEMTVPKYMMISGNIQWQTFNGDKGTFRFSTSTDMVKKIETYLQKRVIKNYQNQYKVTHCPQKQASPVAA